MSSVCYTALSGLNGYSSAIDTVANNLANLQTKGFKASNVHFSDLLGQSMRFDEPTTGAGITNPTAVRQFIQGGLQTSTSPLDCAIAGNGFFVTSDGSKPLYTRDGSFQLGQDASGKTILTTATGNAVQGYAMKADGTADTSRLIDITFPDQRPATMTTAVQFSGNLDDATVPAGQAAFAVPVYDAAGNKHDVSLTFTHEAAAGDWTLHTVVDGTESGQGTPIQFDSSGKPLNAPANITMTVAGQAVTLALNTLTQFASPSNAAELSQNGRAPSPVTGFSIGNGGIVYAQTSDTGDMPVAELALANIANPESLAEVGNGNFRVTPNTMGYAALSSATPATGEYIGDAQTLGTQIVGGATEQSTADVAGQFGALMQYQRAYEMTAKTITTADQMRQDLFNLIS